jgi:hypothetical protein
MQRRWGSERQTIESENEAFCESAYEAVLVASLGSGVGAVLAWPGGGFPQLSPEQPYKPLKPCRFQRATAPPPPRLSPMPPPAPSHAPQVVFVKVHSEPVTPPRPDIREEKLSNAKLLEEAVMAYQAEPGTPNWRWDTEDKVRANFANELRFGRRKNVEDWAARRPQQQKASA